jgi:hypothetical protein
VASEASLETIRRVKERHEASLLSKRNVVGVGIGFRERSGQATDQMALIVSVLRKLPASEVDAADVIPAEIEGVPVDVKEVGEIRALS